MASDTSTPIAGSEATTFTPGLDALIGGLFAEEPTELSDDGLLAGGLGGATPIPQSSNDVEEQDDSSSANQAPKFPFPMPEIRIWIIWLVVTVGVATLALTLEEVRQRRNR
jgi:hypothetical protein